MDTLQSVNYNISRSYHNVCGLSRAYVQTTTTTEGNQTLRFPEAVKTEIECFVRLPYLPDNQYTGFVTIKISPSKLTHGKFLNCLKFVDKSTSHILQSIRNYTVNQFRNANYSFNSHPMAQLYFKKNTKTQLY